eukprot:CAMPEP_0116969268 /NCGR_PEP_ID=MMETSP0467-20121206/51813_1 /TAXON_ID=283647 /ORGANISM="Mesodinium pulex, Strain SPMC105" /LENGTH=132 /DNA_ID=CAMNT_0004659871 /DNA_START=1462 /DNA_END=1860 /DNA_ORIENTATION=+
MPSIQIPMGYASDAEHVGLQSDSLFKFRIEKDLKTCQGLPIGLQMSGKSFQDEQLMQFVHAHQNLFQGLETELKCESMANKLERIERNSRSVEFYKGNYKQRHIDNSIDYKKHGVNLFKDISSSFLEGEAKL